MKCINCNEYEANKNSGWCDKCEQLHINKINGVLYFPALGLVATIFISSFVTYNFIQMIITYYQQTGFISFFSIGGVILRCIHLCITAFTCWYFFGRKKGIRKIIIPYYILGFILTLYFTLIPVIISKDVLSSVDYQTLLSGAFGIVIWVPYFIFSKRINEVFTK